MNTSTESSTSSSTSSSQNPIPSSNLTSVPSEKTTTTMKKKPNGCQFGTCTTFAVKIIGDCRYCNAKFCGKHRLPETHACSGMQSCRQQSMDRNASKLLGEKTVASKV